MWLARNTIEISQGIHQQKIVWVYHSQIINQTTTRILAKQVSAESESTKSRNKLKIKIYSGIVTQPKEVIRWTTLV